MQMNADECRKVLSAFDFDFAFAFAVHPVHPFILRILILTAFALDPSRSFHRVLAG